jgi:uncharacterized membrane protein
MSRTLLLCGLIAVNLFGLAINLYFVSLLRPGDRRWSGLVRTAAQACGVDGGVCAAVVLTPYARIFGGVPNVYVGVVWNLFLLGDAAAALATGRFYLLTPALIIAAASLLVAVYLIAVLLWVLRKPCPL